MKKTISIIGAILLIGSPMSMIVSNKDKIIESTDTIEVNGINHRVRYDYLDLLNEYYNDYINGVTLNHTNPEYSENEFIDIFYDQNVYTISEYTDYLINIALYNNTNNFESTPNIIQSYSSSGDKWYYNVDINKGLTKKPNYGKYNFSQIWDGDILYERVTSNGVTNHVALIEGQFKDSKYGNYWRVIEAGSGGVTRGVLDDDRFIEKKGSLLYVPSSSDFGRKLVVWFATKQLGKPYAIILSKPTSVNQAKWHCSSLVWAAYMYINIDIETDNVFNGVGITPSDIYNCKRVKEYIKA